MDQWTILPKQCKWPQIKWITWDFVNMTNAWWGCLKWFWECTIDWIHPGLLAQSSHQNWAKLLKVQKRVSLAPQHGGRQEISGRSFACSLHGARFKAHSGLRPLIRKILDPPLEIFGWIVKNVLRFKKVKDKSIQRMIPTSSA